MSGILHQSIRRLVGNDRPRISRGIHNARVIAVAARKGGVGKTTTAVNLAAGLALYRHRKVLLIDMDAQGHCASALHAELRGVATGSLSGVLLGKRRDVHEIALTTGIPGLHVTPSDKDLAETEGVMSARIGKEFLLRQAMKVARTHYDVIVIDCAPNLGTLTVNALMAADQVLIPCDMSVLALEGVDDLFDTLETLEDTLAHSLSVLGVLRTRVDARNQRMNETVEEALRTRYGSYVLDTKVPVNTKLAQAQLAGRPVYTFDSACTGTRAYRALLDEVTPRLAA